jgi:hypothetical protein
MLRCDAGDIFGRRVNAHYCIDKLLVLLDNPVVTGGFRDLCYAALDLEIKTHVELIWPENIEA